MLIDLNAVDLGIEIIGMVRRLAKEKNEELVCLWHFFAPLRTYVGIPTF